MAESICHGTFVAPKIRTRPPPCDLPTPSVEKNVKEYIEEGGMKIVECTDISKSEERQQMQDAQTHPLTHLY